MKRLECIWLFVLAIVLAAPSVASAQTAEAKSEATNESDVYSRYGGYVGLGGALAIEDFDDSKGSYDDSAAVILRAGYRGLPFLSVEIVGDILIGFDGGDDFDNDVDGFAATVNAKFHLPLGRIEPFAAVGGGILGLEEDKRHHDREDFVFRFASGADFYLTKHIALYGEASYMLGVGEVSDFDYATVGGGLLLRF